jgi:hypothetical protein
MIHGHCECKRVSFEVDGEITDFSHCHCSQCRRLHGAAYATFAGVKRADFRYLTGEDDLKHYASSADHDRVFCGECGSNIMVVLDGEGDFYVSMSTLEGDPIRPTGYHIYVASKAPWHEINDGLIKFDENES